MVLGAFVFLKCPTNNKSDTVLDKNLVLSNELIREGSPGAAGSWDLTMRKGSAQKMLNEYCTVLNEYLDRECERI